MKKIKYSFIVAIYNVERYIEQCIKSIICQTDDDNIELILVNDGSTDNSLEICEKYRLLDGRIHIINQENQGVSVARNRGLELAQGEWICFIDGDDWIDNNLLEYLNHYIDKATYDVCLFSYWDCFPKKRNSYKISGIDILEFDKGDFEVFQKASFNQDIPYRYDLKKIRLVTPWAKIYSRDFLNKNHLRFTPNLKTGEDNLFNLGVYENAKRGCYFNRELYCHRVNEGAVSQKYNPNASEDFSFLLQEMKKWLIAHKKYTELYDQYNVRILLSLEYCVLLDLCHKDNAESYYDNKIRFNMLIAKEPFKTALKEVKVNEISFRKGMFVRALKTKSFKIVSILVKLNSMYEKLVNGKKKWDRV